jgi:hypothetical protein
MSRPRNFTETKPKAMRLFGHSNRVGYTNAAAIIEVCSRLELHKSSQPRVHHLISGVTLERAVWLRAQNPAAELLDVQIPTEIRRLEKRFGPFRTFV